MNPAFPSAFTKHETWFEGMSLRDYFAGQALQRVSLPIECGYDKLAEACYKIADAMLIERQLPREDSQNA